MNYFTDSYDKKYYVSINVDTKKLPFVKVGDILNIKIYNGREKRTFRVH